MKDSMEGLQKIKIEVSYNPTIPLLGIYIPKEIKAGTEQICVHSYSQQHYSQ